MKILITGASGFLGRALCQEFALSGHKVAAVARQVPQRPVVGVSNWQLADLTHTLSPERWSEIVSGVDWVINAAGVLAEDYEGHYDLIHATGPIQLFQACAKAQIPVIQISAQGAEYSGELPAFLASKRKADQFLLTSGQAGMVVYPSIIIGEGGQSTDWLCRMAVWPVMVCPRMTKATLHPIALSEVVTTIRHMMESSPANPASCASSVSQEQPRPRARAYRLYGAQAMTLAELVRTLRSWLGYSKGWVLSCPEAGFRSLGAIAEHIWPKGFVRRETLELLLRSPFAEHSSVERYPFDSFPLAKVLAEHPPSQDYRLGRIHLTLRPLWIASLALVWIGTGVVSLWLNPQAGYDLLAQAGLSPSNSTILIQAGGWCDLMLAVGLLIPRLLRTLLALQCVVTVIYLIMASMLLPQLWLSPMGELSKTVVLLGVTIGLWLSTTE